MRVDFLKLCLYIVMSDRLELCLYNCKWFIIFGILMFDENIDVENEYLVFYSLVLFFVLNDFVSDSEYKSFGNVCVFRFFCWLMSFYVKK